MRVSAQFYRILLYYIIVQNTLLLAHYKQMWITYQQVINSLSTGVFLQLKQN